MYLPDYQSVADDSARATFSSIWDVSDIPSKEGLTVVEIMDAIHTDKIKSLYILGENPAMSDPNVHHARNALARLSHLVVQDIFLTETANYADVILPAAAWPEKTGTVTNTNRQVQMGRPAVAPPGDAKSRLVDNHGACQTVGSELGLFTPSRNFRRNETRYDISQQHLLGTTGKISRYLSQPLAGRPWPASRFQ
jgi:predicted molibdopterin-dependent oxidoreductase YjgC